MWVLVVEVSGVGRGRCEKADIHCFADGRFLVGVRGFGSATAVVCRGEVVVKVWEHVRSKRSWVEEKEEVIKKHNRRGKSFQRKALGRAGGRASESECCLCWIEEGR